MEKSIDKPVSQDVIQRRLTQPTIIQESDVDEPVQRKEIVFTDLFTEPYDVNRENYIGKLSLDKYIDKVVPKEQFEEQFTSDIVRNDSTVNGKVTNIVVTFLEESNKIKNEDKFKHLSDIFDTFIRNYVPISDEDLRIFKALNCQHGLVLNTVMLNHHFNTPVYLYHFIPVEDSRIYDYTLTKNNYKFKTIALYTIRPYNNPEEIIGNVSYTMLYDITNKSYSANIELHFIQPQAQPVQPSQDECFTFIKRLFGRTGGTRKKSKVYGMPYTYRKVYRKKCYKVSNRLTKRVFAKCTTKKKALRQLRLLRYLESK